MVLVGGGFYGYGDVVDVDVVCVVLGLYWLVCIG